MKNKLKEDLLLLNPKNIQKQDVATLTAKDDSYNFSIKMFQSDSGNPHINFFTKDGKYFICKILLTENPDDTQCIDLQHKDIDENKIKKLILKWAQENDKMGFNNWKWAKKVWRLMHSD